MILLNAIYFKGTWFEKFNEKSTKDEPFYVNGKEKIIVPTMYARKKLVYGERGVKFVEIPFKVT